MKKILTLTIAILTVFMFCSCNDTATPSGVVKECLKCAKNGDLEDYFDLISTSEDFKVDNSNRKNLYKECTISWIEKQVKEAMKARADVDEFKVVSEEIDNDLAKVEISYVTGSGYDHEETVRLRKCADGKWRISNVRSIDCLTYK